jgi:hypothetical protein
MVVLSNRPPVSMVQESTADHGINTTTPGYHIAGVT